jgi:glyoxylase-like metal-dependent hydrolase (beta-lactamase superfamily II)
MKLPDKLDPLPDILAKEGIDPERIDIVINSHLHWDHCGGNTRSVNGAPVASFPRAAYYTSRSEWEHAHTRHPRDAVSYIDANYDPLVNSGQMTLLVEDTEVVPGIAVHTAPGHNRDMMIVTATSGGRTFCFFSDLIPSAAHVTPTWVAAFDLYPLECIDTKTRWLTRAAQENWICGFAHDSRVGFGRIIQDEAKFDLADES